MSETPDSLSPSAAPPFGEMLDNYTTRLIEHQTPPNRHIDAKTCPWCSAARLSLEDYFRTLQRENERLKAITRGEP